jgi:mannose-6-phosphate isomerase-like protein (cupin superfamily)
MTAPSPAPKNLKHDESADGRMHRIGGDIGRVLVAGEETNGEFAVIEALADPGSGPPLHVHHREDEHFYVVEGQAKFVAGGKTILASAGDYVVGPRGVAHTFRNTGATPLRMIIITRPAGFEKFFAAASDALHAAGGFDPAVLTRVAAEYGIEILGPPLTE